MFGPVEEDEVYMGGVRKNMSKFKRKELMGTGRRAVGMTAIVGAWDRHSNEVRAQVVERTDGETLENFNVKHAYDGATIYTDDAPAYNRLPKSPSCFEHDSVKHSLDEYVRDNVHSNGIESFGQCSSGRTQGYSTRCLPIT